MSQLEHIEAIEKRLWTAADTLRTDFQQHYEMTVAEYNREKDRVTIERTFEALLKFEQSLEDEERRSLREELDEELLAIFDLLRKPDLDAAEIRKIKAVAIELLARLKAENLRIDHWRDKETTRDAVRIMIRDHLWLLRNYSNRDW